MIKEYFLFTRKERVAIITLIILIVGIYLIPQVIRSPEGTPSPDELKALASFKQQKNPDSSRVAEFEEDRSITQVSSGMEEPMREVRLFYFDPNTATTGEWQRLGIRDKTIGTIANYLNKGGHFYSPEDLRKIYGLKQDEYARISPYIRISGKDRRAAAGRERSFEDRDSRREPGRFAKPGRYTRLTAIDLNTADTAALIALPGIGSKLANRIISFREKLGGFHSIEQVAEIYGLPDSSFQKIRAFLSVSGSGVRAIDINLASIDQLKQHPYIRWTLASTIIKYREQHGRFTSPEDLKTIGAISQEAFEKMAPYIVVR